MSYKVVKPTATPKRVRFKDIPENTFFLATKTSHTINGLFYKAIKSLVYFGDVTPMSWVDPNHEAEFTDYELVSVDLVVKKN